MIRDAPSAALARAYPPSIAIPSPRTAGPKRSRRAAGSQVRARGGTRYQGQSSGQLDESTCSQGPQRLRIGQPGVSLLMSVVTCQRLGVRLELSRLVRRARPPAPPLSDSDARVDASPARGLMGGGEPIRPCCAARRMSGP